jgi:hypothetical protein
VNGRVRIVNGINWSARFGNRVGAMVNWMHMNI